MSSSFASFIPPRGRGVPDNPTGRFEKLQWCPDPDDLESVHRSEQDGAEPWEPPSPATVCFRDDSQSIISRNDSPDLGFSASLNPYRGCEHGCSYCYARPYHEFLGFSAGLDFETKIMVKPEAPELLRQALGSPTWEPQTLACSGVTDCYQPVERHFALTRACLKVLAEFRNPVSIITKNRLVTRDLDLFQELAHHRAVSVMISLTSLDPALSAKMEPRASAPSARLDAIRALSAAGIPVGVSVAPVIPGLNDHEIPALLQAARDHGASHAAYTLLRLPHCLPSLFFAWLDRHFPERRDRVEQGLREMRGGELNDSRFGHRMKGEGDFAQSLRRLFEVAARRLGLLGHRPDLTTLAFRLPGEQQLFLFETPNFRHESRPGNNDRWTDA